MKEKARKLLELIEEFVADNSLPWKEKKQMLYDEATETEELALDEMISWFPGEEDNG